MEDSCGKLMFGSTVPCVMIRSEMCVRFAVDGFSCCLIWESMLEEMIKSEYKYLRTHLRTPGELYHLLSCYWGKGFAVV
jgi:hypothetical protein